MHEHILKIQERHYCVKNERLEFIPTNLGKALIGAFRQCGRVTMDLTRPYLRARMEREWTAIANAEKDKETVLKNQVEVIKSVFTTIQAHAHLFDKAMGSLTTVNPDEAPLPAAMA
ncbi:bifunctional DNA topoisomerase [Babesia duncani]|uniref:DNA topoisomerase n=1 Tax=Babesia duncani TaxID=323732 RepID=A0AAD9PJG3_9APIC|nr:bifunctional DNA topoisomerase [Babesia duncani]